LHSETPTAVGTPASGSLVLKLEPANTKQLDRYRAHLRSLARNSNRNLLLRHVLVHSLFYPGCRI
jgi:hypothetical protein